MLAERIAEFLERYPVPEPAITRQQLLDLLCGSGGDADGARPVRRRPLCCHAATMKCSALRPRTFLPRALRSERPL